MTDTYADIRERVAKATPGDWEAVLLDDPRGQPQVIYSGLICLIAEGDQRISVVAANGSCGASEWVPNAKLIANCKRDLSKLLADNDRLREENERLRRALEENGIAQAWRDGFLSAADTVASFTTNREFSSYSEVRDTFVDILKRASVGQHEYAKALKDTP